MTVFISPSHPCYLLINTSFNSTKLCSNVTLLLSLCVSVFVSASHCLFLSMSLFWSLSHNFLTTFEQAIIQNEKSTFHSFPPFLLIFPIAPFANVIQISHVFGTGLWIRPTNSCHSKFVFNWVIASEIWSRGLTFYGLKKSDYYDCNWRMLLKQLYFRSLLWSWGI